MLHFLALLPLAALASASEPRCYEAEIAPLNRRRVLEPSRKEPKERAIACVATDGSGAATGVSFKDGQFDWLWMSRNELETLGFELKPMEIESRFLGLRYCFVPSPGCLLSTGVEAVQWLAAERTSTEYSNCVSDKADAGASTLCLRMRGNALLGASYRDSETGGAWHWVSTEELSDAGYSLTQHGVLSRDGLVFFSYGDARQLYAVGRIVSGVRARLDEAAQARRDGAAAAAGELAGRLARP